MSRKVRKQSPQEQMRKAIMDLYRDAQFGHHVKVDNSPMMRSARFIGRTAGRIKNLVCSKWFILIFVIAAVYIVLHWTDISIDIVKKGDVLVRIG